MVILGALCFSRVVLRGRGYAAAEWGNAIVCSCYNTPNLRLTDYEDWLNEIQGQLLRYRGRRLIIFGDFNAWSRELGSSKTNHRGCSLLGWAASLDLHLVNTGAEPTCVRPQGVSIVDLTWVSSAVLRLVTDWCVLTDTETLSDHRYITMSYGGGPCELLTYMRRCAGVFRAWRTRQLDPAAYTDAITAAKLTGGESQPPDSPEKLAD